MPHVLTKVAAVDKSRHQLILHACTFSYASNRSSSKLLTVYGLLLTAAERQWEILFAAQRLEASPVSLPTQSDLLTPEGRRLAARPLFPVDAARHQVMLLTA